MVGVGMVESRLSVGIRKDQGASAMGETFRNYLLSLKTLSNEVEEGLVASGCAVLDPMGRNVVPCWN